MRWAFFLLLASSLALSYMGKEVLVTSTATYLLSPGRITVNGFVTLDYPPVVYVNGSPVTLKNGVWEEKGVRVETDADFLPDHLEVCVRINNESHEKVTYRAVFRFRGNLYFEIPSKGKENLLAEGYMFIGDGEGGLRGNILVLRTDSKVGAAPEGYMSVGEVWLEGSPETATMIPPRTSRTSCVSLYPYFLMDNPPTSIVPPRELWSVTYSRYSQLIGKIAWRNIPVDLEGIASAEEFLEKAAGRFSSIHDYLSVFRGHGIPARLGLRGGKVYLLVYTGVWRVLDPETGKVEDYSPMDYEEVIVPLYSSPFPLSLFLPLLIVPLALVLYKYRPGLPHLPVPKQREEELELPEENLDGLYEVVGGDMDFLEREVADIMKRGRFSVKEAARELQLSEEIVASVVRVMLERGVIRKRS